jgi:hypothetical protein
VKTYDITKGRLDYLRIIGDGYDIPCFRYSER